MFGPQTLKVLISMQGNRHAGAPAGGGQSCGGVRVLQSMHMGAVVDYSGLSAGDTCTLDSAHHSGFGLKVKDRFG